MRSPTRNYPREQPIRPFEQVHRCGHCLWAKKQNQEGQKGEEGSTPQENRSKETRSAGQERVKYRYVFGRWNLPDLALDLPIFISE